MHWTKTLCLALAVALVVVASMAGGAERKLRVVTTIPDLTALAQAVGGDLADVETLTRGTQNAHEAEVRPTMMLKLRRADVLVENGLELDAWADVAVTGANNPNIVRGSAGRIDISRGLPILEVPAVRVDRSMGDVHPLGNPHYSLDPGFAPTITQNILEGFSRLAADGRPTFERNRQAFLDQLNEAMTRWTKTLEPFRGAKVVVYHPQWIYFLSRFGLVQAATLEDRPGIPASPGHLVRVIQQMKAERIKVIIVEPWNDRKLAERVAQEAGAKAIVLASMVGGVKGADSYIGAIDYNVNELSRALR
ncbi:MAG: zinc ABC transporter substrate-binding protein [Candidatus Rokuibacteriota bacterium]|nr:MAG: zinc ABC transporter substrate-binding protein [Candidatus Rokubacteria bacterium]